MTRPKEIYWFAWIQIALLAFGLFSILTNWDVLVTNANAGGGLSSETAKTITIIGLFFGFAVNLLLLLFIWKRSNVARWIYIILSAAGLVLGILGLLQGEGTGPLSATMGQHLVGTILLILLFLPNVRAWFAGKPVDETTFS